jgi:hypothetical protein
MTRILELIAQSRGRFVPEDWRQYVALHLARRMEAVEQIRNFVSLMDQHSLEDVANTYRRISSLPVPERRKALKAAFCLDH